MTRGKYLRLAIIGILAIALLDCAAYAFGRGGRGGGGRGGGGSRGGGSRGGYRSSGGGSRSSYSNHGSIRYSGSSRSGSRSSSPSYSRGGSSYGSGRSSYGGSSYSRSSTPSYSGSRSSTGAGRSYGSSYSRSSTPSFRSSGSGYGQRSYGGAYGSRSYSRPATPSYRPSNSGSIIHSGSATGPRGNTIAGAVGPRGGTAVGIEGSRGGTAGAIQGPRGGGAARVEGPRGGSAGAIKGPRGGGAAGVQGPGGGTAGAVRGPRGAGAAGVSGPRGGTAGAVWGPNGRDIAAGQGPYGNRFVTNLPAGAINYPWRGQDYWHSGYGWWRPSWVGDSMYYGWAYPPIGYWYSSLPDDNESVVINNTTYYESEGVYYQEGEQEGQKGYVVAEAPVAADAPDASAADEVENPYKILKNMCIYVANLDRFTADASTTHDQVRETGEKVQVSSRRKISVSRPDKIAVDVKDDNGERRVVYDGQTVSMLDRTKNIYTAVEVPNTIDGALDKLAQDYNIILPLGDLLYKDLYDRMEARAASGQYLGIHQAGEFKCHHLAFTTESSSWQIWIDAGNVPIPRRITIDYGQGADRSRYSADIVEWTPWTTFSAETFAFTLPPDVNRFEFEAN